MRKFLLVGISTFALGAAAMAGLSAMAYADQKVRPMSADTYKMLTLFGDVLTTVDQQYVVPVDNKKLIQSAIDGMLTSLDPHSGYLDPESFDDMRDQTRGEYGGLGIQVTAEDGAVKIISPMDDSPASRAGIQPGDYITAIEGQSILGLSLNDAVKQMRGPVGTSISLTIAREKQNPFVVRLTREIIDMKTVTHRAEGDFGYLRVAGFDEKTGRETAAAIRDLKAKIPHMKGLVLDMRNNPGGLVDAAVDVASDFLDGGEVVSQRGRDAKDITRYNARPSGDLLKGVPVVVLINNGSASAAEIVAGALKDRRRATVLGLTSFGKGSVQTVIPLRGGADGALKLTTDRYYTPSGGSIQKTGIEPDLFVASSKKQAEAIYDEAMQFSEASLHNALDAQEGRARKLPARIEIPASEPEAPKVQLASLAAVNSLKGQALAEADARDFQLQRALDVLRFGSIQAALRLKPMQSYEKATPKFQTAQATPPKLPGAAAQAAKPVVPSKTGPAEQVGPSQGGPGGGSQKK
jgi:carboxyl-terminal processing protease